MHPTQRKLMKRIILFLSLLFCIACPAIAGQDIDLVANVKTAPAKAESVTVVILILASLGWDIFQVMLLLKVINRWKRVHYHCIRLCITGNWRCAKSVTY